MSCVDRCDMFSSGLAASSGDDGGVGGGVGLSEEGLHEGQIALQLGTGTTEPSALRFLELEDGVDPAATAPMAASDAIRR